MNYTYNCLTDEECERVYNGQKVLTGYGDKFYEEWRPQQELELTLSYNGYDRGRSAVTFYWLDEHGHQYPMFIKDFDELLKLGIGTTTIHAIFTFVKRGQNYGIKFLREASE